MTTKQIETLNTLRSEAEDHGDTKTVALVDLALTGDVAALAKLGIAARAVKAVSTGRAAKAARAPRQSATARGEHPWAHDVE
jgi:hypothetical protein